MLSQSFFRKKDPYLLEHFFAAVNDLIGHFCQGLVAFGDGIQIIVDLHLGPPVFPHIKHGIQRQQHPIPQHLS